MPSFNSVGLNSVNQSPKKIQGIHFFIYNQKIIKKIYKLIYFSRSRCSFEHPNHNLEPPLYGLHNKKCVCIFGILLFRNEIYSYVLIIYLFIIFEKQTRKYH